MPKELPKPRGAVPSQPKVEEKPKRTHGRRRTQRAEDIADRREAMREREARRAAKSRDGEAHERFEDKEYAEGEYDDGGTGEPWLHRENPAVWRGSICDDD